MTKPLNIYQRILAIMADISYICKGEKTVNGQYRFVSHDQATEALQPLLIKHGVTCIPSVMSHLQEGNRTVANMRIYFTNAEVPEDGIFADYFGYGVDAGDKGPGKAISYACKYAFLKVFNIATGDDPDKDAKAVYEPAKCVEFDDFLPDKTNARLMDKFLAHSAEAMGKHVEDVKREAIKRIDDFMKGYDRWAKKQTKESK